MHRSSIDDVGVLASDDTFSLESVRLAANESTGIVSCESDVVLLLTAGDFEIKTGDRQHSVSSSAQAYINAGVSFEIVAGGDESGGAYLMATCPDAALAPSPVHDSKAVTGGVTVLRTDRYDRFPRFRTGSRRYVLCR